MIDEARKHLIFALDVASFEQARHWVELLGRQVELFKVGKQLFTRCGPRVVEMIHDCGSEVFLDLKYHDIPNTVAKAGIEACRLGVGMFNVHALGGLEMMQQTVREVDAWCQQHNQSRPLMLAVTILTSSTEETLRGVGIDRSVTEMVVRLARLTKQAGFDGVVASPQEIKLIREACGDDFAIVTPGVRPLFAARNDQKRVTTPAAAIGAGASHLVIGRPISTADRPIEAAQQILDEIVGALR